jgi:hypothetical protein
MAIDKTELQTKINAFLDSDTKSHTHYSFGVVKAIMNDFMNFLQNEEMAKEVRRKQWEELNKEFGKPEQDDGDWIEWDGDETNPNIGIDCEVEVKFRDGLCCFGTVHDFGWTHNRLTCAVLRKYDIVAYRVVK